jgi:adenosylcobinamide kinase / adenosylcobinamide-phosphate guanylyltransferase
LLELAKGIRAMTATGSLGQLTLVIGGARSGKSRFAEGLARDTGLTRSYIATAEAWDDEMRDRIARHRADRGTDWRLFEAPRDLAATLGQVPPGVVLIDCATLWLSNHLLAESDLELQTEGLINAILNCKASVIMVSNEVGWSIVPDNALARRFRDAQGRLNQRLASTAGLVVAVMAGLPMVLKGRM